MLRTVRFWLCVCALASSGCSSESEEPKNCTSHPSFSVQVEAADGPLPVDTTMLVDFGGNQAETFELAKPEAEHHAVLCHASERDAGASDAGSGDAGTWEAFACDLWTSGAATVTLNGGDYPEHVQELEAKTDDCGPITVDETLLLDHGDAGPAH